MRRYPLEGEFVAPARQRDVRHEIAVEGVEHHRGVEVAKNSRPQEDDLAAPPFFGRGANELDRAPERMALGMERREGPQGPRGYQVVPARVPDFRQSVVLREDGDLRSRPRV